MVSYDDARSFGTPGARLLWVFADLFLLRYTAEKGNFINDACLAGFAMWEAGGDSNDILLDAILWGIGIGRWKPCSYLK